MSASRARARGSSRAARRYHTWQLSECDLSDGDYEATVGRAARTTTFVLNLRDAPAGTRFTFSYRITATDPDPLTLLRIGQSVRVHATSAPTARGAADGQGAAGSSDVRVSVRSLSAAEFTAMTGLSPTMLQEYQIVRAESLLASQAERPDETPTVGLGAAGLGPAGLGAWSATPTPMTFVPPNSTFLLWTEGHLSLGANVNGSLVVRGYRGNLAWYLGEMTPGIGPWFTRQLVTGVPGGWQNDLLFPRLAGVGYPQTVIYLPTSADGAEAFANEIRSFEAGRGVPLLSAPSARHAGGQTD